MIEQNKLCWEIASSVVLNFVKVLPKEVNNYNKKNLEIMKEFFYEQAKGLQIILDKNLAEENPLELELVNSFLSKQEKKDPKKIEELRDTFFHTGLYLDFLKNSKNTSYQTSRHDKILESIRKVNDFYTPESQPVF